MYDFREENELIMQLRGFCPDEKLPRGILLKGREAIKTGRWSGDG